MAEMTEAEAILHLKRALGEIEYGDAVPAPLPPVAKASMPPPKVQKVAHTPMRETLPAPTPVQPSIGPTPRNEIRQPSQAQRQPVLLTRPVGPQMRPPLGPGMVGGPCMGGMSGLGPMPTGISGMGPMGGMGGMGGMAGMGGMGPMGGLPPMGMGGMGTGPGPFYPHGMDGSGPKAVGALPPQKAPLPPGSAGVPPPGFLQAPAPMRPPGQQPMSVSGNQAVAQATAAAAATGKNHKSFEVAQKKVFNVLGKGSATLNAIKAYSKAQCFIEQMFPDDDKATVYVVGTDKEIAKCKQTVKAIIDGSMSISTLFTLAGVPMPRGGVEDLPSMPTMPDFPSGPPFGGMMPPMGGPCGGDFRGMPPPGMMPPGMPPMPPGMMLPGLTGPGGPEAIPGMEQNSQMQRNLNDYYARWWSTYAAGQQDESGEIPNFEDGFGSGGGSAFDKEALQRLADRAAKGLPIEEPPPVVFKPAPMPEPMESTIPPEPPVDEGGECECGEPYLAKAKFCSNCGNKLGLAAVPPPQAATYSSTMPPSVSQLVPPPQQMQLPRGPITLKGFLRPAEPQKPKKDDDALQNMMERLQGNVVQTKQAMEMGAMAPTRPPPPPGPPGMGMGILGAEDDPRTRADYEFEALLGRMQSAQQTEDIENVARELLIRFPSFTPPQVVELLTKVNGTPSMQQYQNGELLAELCRMCPQRLKELSSGQFTTLTSTLASWTRHPNIPKSTRFKDFSKAYFQAASMDMSTRLMAYQPHELNCCLAAFVSVGFSDHKFFASVGRAALARHSSFAPVQLTALLAILSEMRLMQTDLFNAAAAFLSTRAKDLRPVDITRVLRSFAKCGVQHQGLCKGLGDEVCHRYRDKSAAQFKAEDLVEICWAMVVLQHYHEGVFRLMFKVLEKSPTIASDALLQLFEFHLAMDVEHKDEYDRFRPEQDMLDQLEDHYKDNRRDERRCSEKHRNDVASVLKSLVEGSVHVNHRTSFSLLVDVVALRKRSSADGFIHVDVDSSVTQVRSLDQDDPAQAAVIVEGAVALRRRILSKSGLRLVTVRESEWRDLDDSKDKRRYLRSLLTNLGDVLQ